MAWLLALLGFAGLLTGGMRSGAAAADGGAGVERERRPLYAGQQASVRRPVPWSMEMEERAGGPGGAPLLWLNGDGQALPWAGVTFRYSPGEAWQLTPEWPENGFIRFLLNGGMNRYGNPTGPVDLRVRPDCDGAEYQQLRSRFIDRGRGIDEDPEAWQEVLVPLRFWAVVKLGLAVRGPSVQCMERPSRRLGLAQVAFVRFDHAPAWLTERLFAFLPRRNSFSKRGTPCLGRLWPS